MNNFLKFLVYGISQLFGLEWDVEPFVAMLILIGILFGVVIAGGIIYAILAILYSSISSSFKKKDASLTKEESKESEPTNNGNRAIRWILFAAIFLIIISIFS